MFFRREGAQKKPIIRFFPMSQKNHYSTKIESHRERLHPCVLNFQALSIGFEYMCVKTLPNVRTKSEYAYKTVVTYKR